MTETTDQPALSLLKAISDLKQALLALGLDAPVAITLRSDHLERFEQTIRREAIGTFVRDPLLPKQTSVYGIEIRGEKHHD